MALKIGIIGNGGISNAHMDGYKALGDRVEVSPAATSILRRQRATPRDTALKIATTTAMICSPKTSWTP